MLAYLPQTRPTYTHWRGEWGLLSFMIVCSVTVGAANATGLSRFLGTVVGAAFVLANWYATGGDVVGLALLGWLVSFLAFYVMIGRGDAPYGRFILLSYNVSSLYAYSLTQMVDDDDDDEGGVHPVIGEIVYHRVVAVSVGIVWGLVVCRLIWPRPARRKFKEGLAVLYLQMGLVWRRGPLAVLLRGDSAAGSTASTTTTSYMRIGEQAALQRYAAQLQTLRVAAGNEYELRGPFPSAAYGRVMASTQRLLDAFQAMSVVTQKHASADTGAGAGAGRSRLTPGERALLRRTAAERAQLCARTCHVFQVLASSLMLEYPLTDAIPSVMVIRDKLLGKIFQFRKEHSGGGAVGGGGGTQAPPPPVTTTTTTTPTPAPAGSSSSSSGTFVGKAPPKLGGERGGNEDDNNNNNNNNNSNNKINNDGNDDGNDEGGDDDGDDDDDDDDDDNVVVEETDYALLYAYALVTGQVAKELKVVEREIEGLFGRLDEDALLLQ